MSGKMMALDGPKIAVNNTTSRYVPVGTCSQRSADCTSMLVGTVYLQITGLFANLIGTLLLHQIPPGADVHR